MKLKLKAPAKINLGLSILGKFKNNWHEVKTIYTQIDLFDLIELENIKENIIDFSDKSNLVYMAAELIKKESKVKKGVRIKLQKNIPIGSGLGGGSSDAAQVLMGLNKLWGLNLSKKKLINLAKKLGSDVAYFLVGGTKLEIQGGRKAGEFKEMGRLIKGWLVVCWPEIFINSKKAYGKVEDDKIGENEVLWHNDFEIWTLKQFTEIKKIKELMLENGAERSLMSGKGSAVWGVYNQRERAEKTFKELKKIYQNTWLISEK